MTSKDAFFVNDIDGVGAAFDRASRAAAAIRDAGRDPMYILREQLDLYQRSLYAKDPAVRYFAKQELDRLDRRHRPTPGNLCHVCYPMGLFIP